MTDLLIVAGMFYYVSTWHIIRGGHELSVNSSGQPQLTRQHNAYNGLWSNHALVKIVRLMIETNLLTSACALISRYSNDLTCFQPLSVL